MSFFGRIWRWARYTFFCGSLAALAGAFLLHHKIQSLESELPSTSSLKQHHPPQVTRILAKDGTLLGELFSERRTLVSIRDLPSHLKLAVLAAEDAEFYEHEGLNYWGILRAFLHNLRAGKLKQGGSTITQQVVKNTLVGSEKTFDRKLKEALLSRKLEEELKKNEILEIYLNQIYFGQGRYGIEEAAKYIFGHSAKGLSIAESALLAGMIACPESCSPKKNLKRALERRDFVLSQMKAKGFFEKHEDEFEKAKIEAVKLHVDNVSKTELAPEVISYVSKWLKEKDPLGGSKGGYTIYTTIDPKLQEAARLAVRENLEAYDKRHGLRGPLKLLQKKKNKPIKWGKWDMPFSGEPQLYKTYVGVVKKVDDRSSSLIVQVGKKEGKVKLADNPRYNPEHLPASVFAPLGSLIRVSVTHVDELDVQREKNGMSIPAKHEEDFGNGIEMTLKLELGPQGLLVAIDVKERTILALVGSEEGTAGGLDRSTQSVRQPGSTFKPIVYSYALQTRDFTPATLIDINPDVFGSYKPQNYEGWTAKEPLRLREVLANSVNVGAVRVLSQVGPQNVVNWAKNLGFTTPMQPDLSLALGSYEVRAIDLCAAYATFAGGGLYRNPKLISKVLDPNGFEVPLDPPPIAEHQVMDAETAYLITNMLQSVVDHGTATKAKTLGRPIAGKTGTSNESKDTWFSGFSPDIVAATWVGYDDTHPLGAGETGGLTALPGWIQFMKVATQGKAIIDFPRPDGLSTLKINPVTGMPVKNENEQGLYEFFISGTEPTEDEQEEVEETGQGAVGEEGDAQAPLEQQESVSQAKARGQPIPLPQPSSLSIPLPLPPSSPHRPLPERLPN